MQVAPQEADTIARALKRVRAKPVAWRPVTTAGHTPARRWVVTLDDGSTAFVKVATDDLTASWLRDEHLAYSLLRGAAFMPRYLGWYDDGRNPVLAIEDLSDGDWPPPWSVDRVRAVQDCLEEVHAAAAPEGLPRAADDRVELRGGWDEVARDPGPFLGLGLCSGRWLDASLPVLRSAANAAVLDGNALLHYDVRSDNVCVWHGRALLVDWNWTSVGNPLLDVATWLPSLHAEGGPAPEEMLPDGAGELAALCAGFFGARAARPPIPSAPRVRPVQRVQAATALPWAARALGLPPPA